MLDKILNIVKANPEIKDWVLNKTVVDKNEIYLIKNTIESTRTVNKTEYFLSVFVEVDDKQGTTNRTFSENISNEELEKQILEMVFVAKLALNKKYELPYFEENDTEYLAYDATVLENPGKALNLMKEMIFNVTNNEPNVQLASSEIFITCATSKNLSSRGFNHISKSTNIMLELVLLAGKGENQVESHLIRNERFISNFDLKALIKRYSDYAKNNISADTPKSGKYNVIFCEEALNNFFNYYVSQTSASSI